MTKKAVKNMDKHAVMTTNKLIVDFNYEKIDRDFDFYKISKKENFKWGAEIFDAEDKNILACSYAFGDEFFIMTKKNATSRRSLVKTFSECKDSAYIVIEKVSSSGVYDKSLLRLFLNSLAFSDGTHAYNNITGKLYIFNNQWAKRDKQGKYYRIDCLEIGVNNDFCITLEARRLTPYGGKNFNKKFYPKYPVYKFSYINSTLKRVYDYTQDDLFTKESYGKKPKINYLSLQDLKSFNASKLGVLRTIMEQLSNKYAGYFSVKYTKYKDINTIASKRRDLRSYQKIVDDFIQHNSINIVDKVNDTQSNNLIKRLISTIGELPKSATITNELVKDSLNIVVIHDKNYYKDKEISDPHSEVQGNCLCQHVTVEQLASDSKDLRNPLNVIYKELYIKYEIMSGCLQSLYDGPVKEFCKGVSYIIYQNFKDSSKDYMYRLRLDENGHMFFDNLRDEGFSELYDKYSSIAGNWKSTYFFIDNGTDVNIIRKTDEKPLANLSEIYNHMSNELGINQISGQLLLDCLEEIDDSELPGNLSTKFVTNQIVATETYGFKEILDLLPGAKPTMTKFFKVLSEKYHEKTGKVLKFLFRGKDKKDKYLPYCLDINYTYRKFKDKNEEFIYHVGILSDGLRADMFNGPVIRSVHALDDGEIFFEQLVGLLNVGFVKFHDYTAVPFPFKYLREYIKMQDLKKAIKQVS